MLVLGLAPTGGHGNDRHVDQTRPRSIWPRREIAKAGLLPGLPERNVQWTRLPRPAVAADVQPALHPVMPAQKDAPSLRVHDDRGASDVQR